MYVQLGSYTKVPPRPKAQNLYMLTYAGPDKKIEGLAYIVGCRGVSAVRGSRGLGSLEPTRVVRL